MISVKIIDLLVNKNFKVTWRKNFVLKMKLKTHYSRAGVHKLSVKCQKGKETVNTAFPADMLPLCSSSWRRHPEKSDTEASTFHLQYRPWAPCRWGMGAGVSWFISVAPPAASTGSCHYGVALRRPITVGDPAGEMMPTRKANGNTSVFQPILGVID